MVPTLRRSVPLFPTFLRCDACDLTPHLACSVACYRARGSCSPLHATHRVVEDLHCCRPLLIAEPEVLRCSRADLRTLIDEHLSEWRRTLIEILTPSKFENRVRTMRCMFRKLFVALASDLAISLALRHTPQYPGNIFGVS